MKTSSSTIFCVATSLTLWASSGASPSAQSSGDSPLLPIEVKCPIEGSQTYVQVSRRADGLTIKYSIKYDGDTATEVRAEVATSDSLFRIVDEIDLLSPTTDDEKKALAAAIIATNQPAFDAICRGSSADKDRYEQQLLDNARQQGTRP